jgi:hypothetical protein
MKVYTWSVEKNKQLMIERGISFEEIVVNIQQGNELDILEHPKPGRYPGQRISVVLVDDYVFLVPFVETAEEIFLKTVIPSRKATRQYLVISDE